MKKIFMFLCCICALNVNMAFADRNCPATSQFELSNSQNGKDNELIYENSRVYNEVLDCVKAGDGKVCKITNGSIYECDKEQGCKTETYLFGKEGYVIGRTSGRNYGVDMSNKILKCERQVDGDDVWTRFDYIKCPENMNGWNKKLTFANDNSKACYYNACYTRQGNYCKGGYCCKDSGGSSAPSSHDCGNAAHWDNNAGECVCNDTAKKYWKEKKICTMCLVKQKEMEHCFASQDEADWKESSCNCVCRDPGKVWNGIACVRETHACGNDASWNGSRCVCQDSTKEWNETKKQCVENSVLKCVSERKGNVEGQACCWLKESVAKYNKETKKCECTGGKEFYTITENGYVKGRCKDQSQPVPEQPEPEVVPEPEPEVVPQPEEDINDKIRKLVDANKDLVNRLSGWKGTLSVWKNKEGNFNTARLASDSIAGVVLGTAGGLITSHVVKKSQIKSGFEDISCTIGGQKVADWHDEFTVGVQ